MMSDGPGKDMIISSSRVTSIAAMLPFGYYSVSRLRSARDIAYLIVTSWLPAIWLVWRDHGGALVNSVAAFAMGYLAFIAIYEIGYLANDQWDARRDPQGRERLALPSNPLLLAIFCLIRIAAWLVIATWTGWVHDPVWIGGFGALTVVVTAHNLLKSASLRLATFAQLATLRFVLPIVAALSFQGIASAAMTALLVYVPLRYLAYADSKALLSMPERKAPTFGALYIALALPLVFYLAWALGIWPMAEIAVFLTFAQLLWAVVARQLNGAN